MEERILNRGHLNTMKDLINQMTTPSPEIFKAVPELKDDIMILGVGGKMGPTLAELIINAGGNVIGVDVFPDEKIQSYLDKIGVQTVRCDLFSEKKLANLPDAPNIFLLAGTKFGATGNEPFVWAMNTYLPGKIMARFKRSKIVYLSSGNVYKFIDVTTNGANENDEVAPIGEYAMSRLGGERILEYENRRNKTPSCIVRLFYATELRYGVIHDIAKKIKEGTTIDLSMGHFNQIWQGDACAYLIRCLSLCKVPAMRINLTGPEALSVREVATKLGKLMGIQPRFTGYESATALLGDASQIFNYFGKPKVEPDQIIEWVASWVMKDGESLGKPTKFEKRNGKF